MALLVKQTNRYEHPTEPGQWFDLSLPLTARDLAGVPSDVKTESAAGQHMILAAIAAWSYDVPVTFENLQAQDLDTMLFLQRTVQGASGIRGDEEKKASVSSSTRTSGRARASSRPLSGT